MTNRILPLSLLLLTLSLAGCVESKCPQGTVAVEGRCVEAPDGGDDAEVPTCLETCGGATPHCDPVLKSCVACLSDANCGDATPACNSVTRSCVACTGDQHCGGSTPACNPSSLTCVACTGDQHCTGPAPVCDTGTLSCVACLDNDDCTSPSAARCNTPTRTCATCQADSDCTHLGSTPICNETTGACVACTTDTEAARCGGNSCSELTYTCTQTPRGSVGSCGACVSDSDCPSSSRCAWYDGYPLRELICMPKVPVGSGCNTAGMRPYASTLTVTTVDGESAMVCGPKESSCAALAAYTSNATCLNSSDCGPGGRCLLTGPRAGHCSVYCENDYHCSAADYCDVSVRCLPRP